MDNLKHPAGYPGYDQTLIGNTVTLITPEEPRSIEVKLQVEHETLSKSKSYTLPINANLYGRICGPQGLAQEMARTQGIQSTGSVKCRVKCACEEEPRRASQSDRFLNIVEEYSNHRCGSIEVTVAYSGLISNHDTIQNRIYHELDNKMIEDHMGQNAEFVTGSSIKSVISKQMVSELFEKDESLRKNRNKIDKVVNDAPKLLAALVLARVDRLGAALLDFIEEEFLDNCMPFKKRGEGAPSFCENEPWYKALLENQWKTLTVTLKPMPQPQHGAGGSKSAPPQLPEQYPPQWRLPFISYKRLGAGGYGEVFEVVLVDDHDELYTEYNNEKREEEINPPMALKKLKKDRNSQFKKKEFDKETKFMQGLDRHPHLNTLIAAWSLGDEYYLLFPLARCTLNKVLSSENHTGNSDYMAWMLEQLQGLCDGLEQIHKSDRNPRYPESSDTRNTIARPASGATPQTHLALPSGAGHLDVPPHNENRKAGEKRDQIGGWHHDLSLMNILVFANQAEQLDGLEASFGRLVISDFGLANTKEKASGVPNSIRTQTISGLITYYSPECDDKVNRFQSRKKDIWSMGCIILECVVWLLWGPERFKEFDEERTQFKYNSRAGISTNSFYFFPPTNSKAQLKKPVQDEINKLREARPYNTSNDWLLKLASLIQKCLAIDKEHRPRFFEVYDELSSIQESFKKCLSTTNKPHQGGFKS